MWTKHFRQRLFQKLYHPKLLDFNVCTPMKHVLCLQSFSFIGLADPAKKPVSKKTAEKKKPTKMKKPFKIPEFEGLLPDKCPAKYRFCRSKTTCFSVGPHKTVCNARRLCFCSMCPKNTQRFCGFLDRKTTNSNSYTLVCRCRSKPKQNPKPKPKRKPKPKTS